MAIPAQRLPRYRHRPLRAPDWATSRQVYRPRRPTATPLYPVVQHHLETFLAQAAEADPLGYGVPSWVELVMVILILGKVQKRIYMQMKLKSY